MILSASILSNETKGEELVKRFNNTKANYIHLDIMDGKFVNNKSFTMKEIKKINDISLKPFDVHLMVKNPEKYINEFSILNTISITFHYEAVKDIDYHINLIKSYGLKCGIAINPETDVNVLLPYLEKLDLVNVMSVHPGLSGQSFINDTYDKIINLKNIIKENNYKTLIEVDGGINDTNIEELKSCGADILVSASFIQNNIDNIDLFM